MIILLDRDGIINKDSIHYIKNISEFIFIPGSVDAIAKLTKANYIIGIATNQSGVARGHYNEPTLARIHEYMLAEIRARGGDIAAIEYCPHHPDEHCFCRKPNPGMLLNLGKRLNCDLKNVPFVGDKITDILAAEKVGASPILITEKNSETDLIRQKYHSYVPIFPSLAHYVDDLL